MGKLGKYTWLGVKVEVLLILAGIIAMLFLIPLIAASLVFDARGLWLVNIIALVISFPIVGWVFYHMSSFLKIKYKK